MSHPEIKVGDIIRPAEFVEHCHGHTAFKWEGKILPIEEVEVTALNPDGQYFCAMFIMPDGRQYPLEYFWKDFKWPNTNGKT